MFNDELWVEIGIDPKPLKNGIKSATQQLQSLAGQGGKTEKALVGMTDSATAAMKRYKSAINEALKGIDTQISQYKGAIKQIFDVKVDDYGTKFIDIDAARAQIDALKSKLPELEDAYDRAAQKASDLFENDQMKTPAYVEAVNKMNEAADDIASTQEKIRGLEIQLAGFGDTDKGIKRTTDYLLGLKERLLDVSEELERFKKQYNTKIEAGIDYGDDDMFAMAEHIRELTNEQELLIAQIKKSKKELDGFPPPTVKTKLKDVKNQLKDFKDSVNDTTTYIKSKTADWFNNLPETHTIKLQVAGFNELKYMFAGIGQDFTNMGKLLGNKLINPIKERFTAIKDWFAESSLFGPAIIQLRDLASTFGKYLVDSGKLKAIALGIGKAWGVVGKAMFGVVKTAGKFLQKINPLSGIVKKIGGAFQRLGRMITTAFVFNAASSFFNQMRDQITKYLKVNVELQTALGRMRGTWLIGFQPIYEMVLPALIKLVNYLQVVGNAFANLMSKITGKSLGDMRKNAEALYNQAQSAEDVAGGYNKASKARDKYIAGFDELNVLPDASDMGGGFDGLKDIDYTAFEDLKDIHIGTWAEEFRNLIDWLLGKMPAFNNLMEKAGQKVNGFSDTLISMFEQNGIQEKVYNLGAGIANGFNTLFESIDFTKLGRGIGDGLTTVIHLVQGFVEKLDFRMIGQKLSQGINGLLNAVDWSALGKTVMGAINGIFSTLAGFFEELDWKGLINKAVELIKGAVAVLDIKAIVDAFHNFITGVITAVGELIANPDTWKTLIVLLLQALELAFMGLWEMTAWGVDLIFEILGSIFDLVGNLLPDGPVKEVCKAIADGLRNGISDELNAIKEAICGFFERIIDWFKEVFGIHSPSTVMAEMGGFLVEGIGNGISEKWETLKQKCITLMNNLKTTFSNTFNAIRTTVSNIWEGIKTSLSTIWLTIKSTATTTFTNIKTSVINVFNTLKSALKTPINGIIDIINGLIRGATSGINNVIDLINSVKFTVPTNAVTSFFGIAGKGWGGFGIPHINVPQIPKLASGGVITKPTIAMMGEYSGANRNPEIVAPQELLESIMNKSNDDLVEVWLQTTRQIISAIEGKDLSVSIGDDAIAKSVVRSNNASIRKTGSPLLGY